MDTRFVIFVVITTLLVVGIYSSSAYFLFAESNTYCRPAGKGQTRCVVTDEDTKTATSWLCEKKPSGGGYTCVEVKPLKEDSTPTGLNNALDKAILAKVQANITGDNDTKLFDRLNDGGLLKGQGDNQTTSKTIVPTQDRFCLEGTGGNTGKACIHCDPGLTFEVGCVDVLTGGPLDMPNTATSDSEEKDDTNPKDLDGSNDDENGPNVNPGRD